MSHAINKKKTNAPREASVPAMIAAVVVLFLLLGVLWWKFMGPGSSSSKPVKPPTFRDPMTGKVRFGTPAEPPEAGGGQ